MAHLITLSLPGNAARSRVILFYIDSSWLEVPRPVTPDPHCAIHDDDTALACDRPLPQAQRFRFSVIHVVIPQGFRVVNFVAIELRTIPAVQSAHGFGVTAAEIVRAATEDEILDQNLGVGNFLSVRLRAKPSIQTTKSFVELHTNAKFHGGSSDPILILPG